MVHDILPVSYTHLDVYKRQVYGRAQPEDEARALLRPHIARLRNKLETTGITSIELVSIRGMGYMLQTEF